MNNQTNPPIEGMTQYECFAMHLPDSLYLNHYRLHDIHPKFTPESWRKFLKEHDHFIRTELSAITEAEARSALQKLTTGNAKSADISAIKQILVESQALNSQTRDARTFITTHMNQPVKKPPTQQEIIKMNVDNVATMFNHIKRSPYKYNADGTLHFTDPQSELELAYLRLFNPDNHLNEDFSFDPPEEDTQ